MSMGGGTEHRGTEAQRKEEEVFLRMLFLLLYSSVPLCLCVLFFQMRAKRAELSTTASELAAMPRPASQGGIQPASASGTHTAL